MDIIKKAKRDGKFLNLAGCLTRYTAVLGRPVTVRTLNYEIVQFNWSMFAVCIKHLAMKLTRYMPMRDSGKQ